MSRARSYSLKRMTAIAEGALGECLVAQRRYADAEPLLTHSEATLRQMFGPQHGLAREAAERLRQLRRHTKRG